MSKKSVVQLSLVTDKSANRAEILQVAQPDIRVEIGKNVEPELTQAVAEFFGKHKKDLASLTSARGEIPGEILIVDANTQTEIAALANGTKKPTVTRRLGSALLCTPAQPMAHQKEAMRLWTANNNESTHMLLNFSMGSGKSLAALFMIAAAATEQYRVLIVCSNTMIGHWLNEIKRVPLRQYNDAVQFIVYTIVGYTEFRRMVNEEGQSPKFVGRNYDTLVIDEAHYYRNLTPAMQIDVDALRCAKRTILVTGTPLQNDVGEVPGMLFLLGLCGDETLAEAEKKLKAQNSMFFYNPSLHGSAATKLAYPTIVTVKETVPMSVPQTVEYCFSQKRQTDFGDCSVSTARCNSYNSLTRAISNTLSDDALSPKFERVINNILSGKFAGPHVVYSHYRSKGVERIAAELKKKSQLKTVLMTGSTAARERDLMISGYNGGKVDVFFITDAAREGIDLHGTGTMHLLEPHENLYSERQTGARVARHNSHPPGSKVTIVKYISTFPCLTAKDNAAIAKHIADNFDLDVDHLDCTKQLKLLIRDNSQDETVDEEYERRNVGKAAQLKPWIEMFERIGLRKFAHSDETLTYAKVKKVKKEDKKKEKASSSCTTADKVTGKKMAKKIATIAAPQAAPVCKKRKQAASFSVVDGPVAKKAKK